MSEHVIPFPAAHAASLIKQHWQALHDGGPIPEADLPALVEAIEAPAREKVRPAELDLFIAAVAAAWQYPKASMGRADVFRALLTRQMSAFAGFIVRAALDDLLSRGDKFPPTIGQFCEAARVAEAKYLRPAAWARDRMERAEWRRAKAEAEAAGRAMMERAAAEERAIRERRLSAERDRLVAIHGRAAEALALDDIERAPAGMRTWARWAGWEAALAAGEPWALRVLPIAALMARIHPEPGRRAPAYGRGLWEGQACAVLAMAEHDVAGARALAAQCEASNTTDAPEPSMQRVVGNPPAIFAQIVGRYRELVEFSPASEAARRRAA